MAGQVVERGEVDGHRYTVWQANSGGKKFVTVFDGGRQGRGTRRSMSWLKKRLAASAGNPWAPYEQPSP